MCAPEPNASRIPVTTREKKMKFVQCTSSEIYSNFKYKRKTISVKEIVIFARR
jgi:hypothetical protein